MLLNLYVRETSGASTTAAQLQEPFSDRRSSAARWLRHLETAGLVTSRPPSCEPRYRVLELTHEAREVLKRHLRSIKQL